MTSARKVEKIRMLERRRKARGSGGRYSKSELGERKRQPWNTTWGYF
jgi:hypothetical protein